MKERESRLGGHLGLLVGVAVLAAPQLGIAQSSELADLSLEELGAIRVISVSRQPQTLSETPSAIQVITADQIRRSGATSIPEALRLATNLQVAQTNAQEWVITARGYSSDAGNKLLVMIDGRTVYTPQFSGVTWNRQDYLLGDIERIEVISGPGGALWGTNAVNGVINIITRSTHDTQGGYVEAGGGTELQSLVGLRYGGSISPDVDYRVFANFSDYDGSAYPDGTDVSDGWHRGQLGFRVDGRPNRTDRYTIEGAVYELDAGSASGGRATDTGSHVLGLWSRDLSDQSDLALQVYYDTIESDTPVAELAINGLVLAPAGELGDVLNTFDVDFQHGFRYATGQRLLWGLGYRRSHNDLDNAPALGFFPEHLDQELFSGFVQNETILIPDRMLLTLGTKLLHNDYTGWEHSPSVRLQYNLDSDSMLWGAISRAVRMPSRIDRDFSQPTVPYPPLNLILLTGGSNFESENVLAWEAGFRSQMTGRLNSSISFFYNEYDDIRSASLSPVTVFPLFFENNIEGETYGVEVNFDLQMQDWWRLSGGYNLLRHDLRVKSGRFDFNNALNETADPENQISLQSAMDLRDDLTLDIGLRWVDELLIDDGGAPDTVPAYTELGLRLGWRPVDNIELSLVGRNLLDSRHPEFGVTGPEREEIERSFFARVVMRF